MYPDCCFVNIMKNYTYLDSVESYFVGLCEPLERLWSTAVEEFSNTRYGIVRTEPSRRFDGPSWVRDHVFRISCLLRVETARTVRVSWCRNDRVLNAREYNTFVYDKNNCFIGCVISITDGPLSKIQTSPRLYALVLVYMLSYRLYINNGRP